MPTADALTGLGMPAQLAAILETNPNALTCTGTSQTTAAIIKSRETELLASASNTGAIPSPNAAIGDLYFLFASASTTAVVYVPVGHTLNGALNGSINVVQNKSLILWQYKKGFWASNLSA